MDIEHDNADMLIADNYDIDGQLSLFDPPAPYIPDINDIIDVPRMLVGCIGKVTMFAEQILYIGLQSIKLREHSTYEGTELGMYYKEIEDATGIDFTEGMISCLKISEVKRQLEIGKASGRFYKQLDELMNTPAMVTSWNILYKDDNRSLAANVVSASLYDKTRGEILILFNDRLKPRLYELTRGYAGIPRSLMMHGFRSHFGFELYQLLKDQLGFIRSCEKKKGYPEKKEYAYNVSLAELFFATKMIEVDASSKNKYMLKAIMMISEGEYEAAYDTLMEGGLIERTTGDKKSKSYVTKWGDFKRHCLDAAYKDINGFEINKGLDKPDDEIHDMALASYNALCDVSHPTDIHFYYVTNRSGRGAKIDSLTFYIRQDVYSSVEQPAVPDGNRLATIGESIPPEAEEVKELLAAEGWTDQNILAIGRAAEWDMEKIRIAYTTCREAPREKPVGFMIEAIKNGWTPNRPDIIANDDEIHEEYPMEWIREHLQYTELIKTHPEHAGVADYFFDTIYETLNSDAGSFKVGRVTIPADEVRKRMLELNAASITDGIEAFVAGNSGMRPSIAYVRTILYYIKNQTGAGSQTKVSADKSTIAIATPQSGNAFSRFPQRQYDKDFYKEMELRKLRTVTEDDFDGSQY